MRGRPVGAAPSSLDVPHSAGYSPFKHPAKPGKATVRCPQKDVPEGPRQNILRQAGLKDLPTAREER